MLKRCLVDEEKLVQRSLEIISRNRPAIDDDRTVEEVARVAVEKKKIGIDAIVQIVGKRTGITATELLSLFPEKDRGRALDALDKSYGQGAGEDKPTKTVGLVMTGPVERRIERNRFDNDEGLPRRLVLREGIDTGPIESTPARRTLAREYEEKINASQGKRGFRLSIFR